MYELRVEDEFAAAHFLRGYEGKCENLHGHNWKVEVRVASGGLGELGMVMDFKKLKGLVAEVLEMFDHKCLNEIDTFSDLNPTTENVARIIYNQVASRLPAGVEASRVTCWESDRCGAGYFE